MALSEAWLQQIIDREVEGVELVLLEQVGGKGQKVVRLFIDHAGGVTHELCGRVSDAVSVVLDVHAGGQFSGVGEALAQEGALRSAGGQEGLRKDASAG
jgi:hypothetical protein